MASKQIIGYGATVETSLDGSTGWASIPECQSIAVPTVETDYPDVTSLDSPDGFREYIKGMKDAGVITVNAGYTSLGYAQQLDQEAEADPIYYRVTLAPNPDQSTGDVFQYRGFPTPQIQSNDIGQPVQMTVSIRTTGGLTHTEGAAAV